MATKLFLAGMASTAACAATLLQQPEEHLAELPKAQRQRWAELERYTRRLADELAALALKKD